jgi:hypothetical protein
MAASNIIPDGLEHKCELCHYDDSLNEPRGKVWYCVECASLICDECWPTILPPHEAGRKKYNGLAHEKVDPRIQRLLHNILHSTVDSLEDDEETTWFGKLRPE